MLVVADSSPLIYLSRAGVLHVLLDLFEEAVVPRAVWDEVVERRRDAPGADALRQATWIRVAENPAVDVNLGLDAGETSAIVLAEMLRADLLLIDERVGRSIARERGLEVCGTLGVLVLARQSDAVPALKPVLEFFDVADSQLAPIRSYNLKRSHTAASWCAAEDRE